MNLESTKPTSSENFCTQIEWSKFTLVRSGCGSVGRVVAINTRGPRFDSSHRQNFIEHLFIINCIEKTKINKKRPGMAHFKKRFTLVKTLFRLLIRIKRSPHA